MLHWIEVSLALIGIGIGVGIGIWHRHWHRWALDMLTRLYF